MNFCLNNHTDVDTDLTENDFMLRPQITKKIKIILHQKYKSHKRFVMLLSHEGCFSFTFS